MNTTLFLFLALPMICGPLLWYFNRERINMPAWQSIPLAVLPGFLVIAIAFGASYGAAVSDTETISGQITGKDRIHDSYEQPYQCMCTSSNGTTTCQTCYETHYTVEWKAKSTVGEFEIEKYDRTSRLIYMSPDPARYASIQPGDPASRNHRYTNYVQAVSNSLFSTVEKGIKTKFVGKIPEYPDRVYDFYNVDRFVQYGFAFTDASQWSKDISMMLRTLGPTKQVNVIVAVVKSNDPMYADALRDAWEGVNKNDVVLVIGSLDGISIDWVRVVSWTKNELFKVELRDGVMDLKIIERVSVLKTLETQIAKNFERRRMREFSYLAGEIDPPSWLLILLFVVLIAGYGGVTWRLQSSPRNSYSGLWNR